MIDSRKRLFDTEDWLLISAGIVGIVYYASVFRAFSPETAVEALPTRERALNLVRSFLRSPDLSLPGDWEQRPFRLQIRSQRALIHYMLETEGRQNGIARLSREVPAYAWEMEFLFEDERSFRLSRGDDDNSSGQKPEGRRLAAAFDANERLLSFTVHDDKVSRERLALEQAPASSLRAAMTVDSASTHVLLWLDRLGFDPVAYRETNRMNMSDRNSSAFEFTLEKKERLHGLTETLRVRIRDGLLSGFERKYAWPESFVPYTKRWFSDVQDIVQTVLVLLATILTIIYFFVRFRKGAFDFRLGLFFGFLTMLSFSVMMYTMLSSLGFWILLLIMVFAGGWWGFASGIIVSVSAAVARDAWPEKYQTFEAVRFGHVLNRRFGISLFRGLMFSFALVGGIHAVMALLPGSFYLPGPESHTKFDGQGGWFLLGSGLYSSIIFFHSYGLLFLSVIRLKIRSRWVLYSAGMLVFTLYPYVFSSVFPLETRLILGLFIAAGYTFAAIRYDFLTLFVTGLLSYLILEGSAFLLSGDIYQGAILITAVGGLALLAVLGLTGRETGDDILEYVPDYVRELQQKQRMAREFEIARHIQTTMLCCKVPASSRFELATLCDPAYEVGGDYYDFIDFGNTQQKFGVVIGDVSGKGVSAAFYMTLIKGIVQTQARLTAHSTRETLAQANDIFYDQVERGRFISMIYAIFDLERMQVQMSRAGHNPLIVKQSVQQESMQVLSGGIALGLARGAMFRESLEEITVPLRSGDLFVLYTDGFSEAMNRRGEEFGEERLHRIIQDRASATASEIISAIRSEVSAFVGPTAQHDDMTMIVVKVR